MGWSSGSEIAETLVRNIKMDVVDSNIRKRLYRVIINEFSDHDCDTLDECKGVDPIYDDLYDEIFPADEWDELPE